MSPLPQPGAPFLDPRHVQARDAGRRLALDELEAIEETAEADLAAAARACVQRMGKEGLLRHVVPQAYGGASVEVEARAIVAAREGVAYGSGLADALLALQGLGSLPITIAGTQAQRTLWLPRIASGQAIPAFAVTEPDAGSDVASMTTHARRTADGWEVSGAKTFISNAGIADYYLLFAKTDPQGGHRGVSAFVVPAQSKGISVDPLALMAAHPIGTVRFDGVKVSRDALVGVEGDGFRLALQTLDRMRPTVAAAACGMAARALDAALDRARTRTQFDKPLAEHQGLRWKLAEAATDLEAARLLTYRAAWLKDNGQERITLESAQAKLFATEAAQRIVDASLQVHGGSGTVRGSIVERLYREVRALRIYEGTSEVLRDVVGRAILRA